MAISSESLLSAVMDMEGTQKCLLCIPWENKLRVSLVYIRGQ